MHNIVGIDKADFNLYYIFPIVDIDLLTKSNIIAISSCAYTKSRMQPLLLDSKNAREAMRDKWISSSV